MKNIKLIIVSFAILSIVGCASTPTTSQPTLTNDEFIACFWDTYVDNSEAGEYPTYLGYELVESFDPEYEEYAGTTAKLYSLFVTKELINSCNHKWYGLVNTGDKYHDVQTVVRSEGLRRDKAYTDRIKREWDEFLEENADTEDEKQHKKQHNLNKFLECYFEKLEENIPPQTEDQADWEYQDYEYIVNEMGHADYFSNSSFKKPYHVSTMEYCGVNHRNGDTEFSDSIIRKIKSKAKYQ